MNIAQDNSKPSSYRWVILLVMWLATFIGCLAQFQVAALAFKIIPDLHLTSSQFALIMSAPMLPAVLLSLVAGSLADRFGVKTVVTVGFAFSVVGVYFRYVATDFTTLFIMMVLAGLSSALLNANAAKLLGAWFPMEKMGTAMGLYFSSAATGITVALATSAMFPTIKSAYIAAGVFMLIVWIAWMALIKAKPKGAPEMPVMPVTKYIGVVAQSKNVWLVGLGMMFFMGANMAFSGFLPNALNAVRGVDPVTAGLMASIVTIGTMLGAIVGPAMSDRVGRIKPFLAPICILGALTMYAAWIVPTGAVMWVTLFVLGIFMGISSPLLMTFPMLLPEIGPAYAGTAGGMIATLQLLGAFIIPAFIITPLAGSNFSMLFGLSSLFFLLLGVVSLFLPELGSKARAQVGKTSAQSV
ncbi:MFS transporter [Desulfosporosinus metallidurans]|uniref:Putative glucarate transporter n=1 Tax=Desulfosporosinus metallidurans TaxID=1888891 RepID=A0A1Q8QR69_9FIRM|nr:MFS transporter [Desulfosporosinus metallidurans]OLN29816.1 putative glucarate transporter [Desulfosporosinus metallidurans]